MATQLKNILSFVAVPPGVPTSLPHGLNWNTLAVVPDIATPSAAGFTITADFTNVTVTNTLAVPLNVDVLVESWHTHERDFGAAATTVLAPQPFVPDYTDGGGQQFPPERTIVVEQGGPISTITAGLAAAAALIPAPSAVDPAMVWVFPGVYQEAPLAMIPYVAMTAADGAPSTIIEATTTTAPLITMAVEAEIRDFTLRGADGVGGIGVLHNTAGLSVGRNIRVNDCETAYRSTGVGTNLTLVGCLASRGIGQTMSTAFEAVSGGTLRAINTQAIGVPGVAQIVNGLRADGAGSGISVQAVTTVGCDNGAHVSNTAIIDIVSGIMQVCTNGLRIGATSGTLRCNNVRVQSSTAWDLLIEAATGTYLGTGGTLRNDQLSIVVGATVLSSHLSEIPGEQQHQILGEFAVGSETAPAEAAFGGGDSNVRNMSVFRNTNLEVGAWSDITAEMASRTGSTADAFPGVGVGNTLYVGGAVRFNGIKTDTTAAIVLGAGALIWEYWNGAAWANMAVLASDGNAPYAQYSEDTFGRINSEQVRFNFPAMGAWATKSLNGTTKYWVRCRISSAITTVPTLENIKLGPSRFEVNADGLTEAFGDGEKVRELIMHQRLVDDLQGSSPGNATINFSANVSITPVDNSFNNGAVDGVGAIVTVPEGLDTTRPVVLAMRWIPSANGGGPGAEDVELETILVPVQLGDALTGALPETAFQTIEIVGGADQDILRENEFTFDLRGLTPGNQFVFSLFRDASAGNPDDDYGGNVEVVSLRMTGTFWR